jgi:hypothetical protein
LPLADLSLFFSALFSEFSFCSITPRDGCHPPNLCGAAVFAAVRRFRGGKKIKTKTIASIQMNG